jgi:hypothetical protein
MVQFFVMNNVIGCVLLRRRAAITYSLLPEKKTRRYLAPGFSTSGFS